MVGHRSTLQSRVTVAIGYGGLPPCLDRFQATEDVLTNPMVHVDLIRLVSSHKWQACRIDGAVAIVHVHGSSLQSR